MSKIEWKIQQAPKYNFMKCLFSFEKVYCRSEIYFQENEIKLIINVTDAQPINRKVTSAEQNNSLKSLQNLGMEKFAKTAVYKMLKTPMEVSLFLENLNEELTSPGTFFTLCFGEIVQSEISESIPLNVVIKFMWDRNFSKKFQALKKIYKD